MGTETAPPPGSAKPFGFPPRPLGDTGSLVLRCDRFARHGGGRHAGPPGGHVSSPACRPGSHRASARAGPGELIATWRWAPRKTAAFTHPDMGEKETSAGGTRPQRLL